MSTLPAAVHSDFSIDDNLARMVFLDPVAYRFYRDWDRTASATVAELHRATGLDPDDPRLNEIIGELSQEHRLPFPVGSTRCARQDG